MNDTEEPDEKAWLKTELGGIIQRISFSKSIGWKIENEWRLARTNNETTLKIQKIDLLDETITGVYLGCRISDNVKSDVIFETRHRFPNARIFVARKVKGDFSLEFEQL